MGSTLAAHSGSVRSTASSSAASTALQLRSRVSVSGQYCAHVTAIPKSSTDTDPPDHGHHARPQGGPPVEILQAAPIRHPPIRSLRAPAATAVVMVAACDAPDPAPPGRWSAPENAW